jgi:hypothetical protein
MARGGKREGSGRKPGSVNKLDQEARARVLESGEETPLDFLLRVMRGDEQEFIHRLDAAKAAAPYVHAKLSSVDLGNKDDKPFEQVIRWAQQDSEATPDPSKK